MLSNQAMYQFYFLFHENLYTICRLPTLEEKHSYRGHGQISQNLIDAQRFANNYEAYPLQGLLLSRLMLVMERNEKQLKLPSCFHEVFHVTLNISFIDKAKFRTINPISECKYWGIRRAKCMCALFSHRVFIILYYWW